MPGVCHFCNQPKPSVHRHRATNILACQPCYRDHLKPKYICIHCQRERSAGKWVVRDGIKQPVCGTCYRKLYLKDECKYCHHRKRIAMRDQDGQAVCERCYQKFEKLEVCTVCGHAKRVTRRIDGRPYCSACRKLQRIERCAGCQTDQVIFGSIGDQPFCRPCYRRHHVAVCQACNRPRTIYARGLCGQCYSNDRVAAAELKIRLLLKGTLVYHSRTHAFATVRYVRTPHSRSGLRRPLRSTVVVDVQGQRYVEPGTPWPISTCRFIQPRAYSPSPVANTSDA